MNRGNGYDTGHLDHFDHLRDCCGSRNHWQKEEIRKGWVIDTMNNMNKVKRLMEESILLAIDSLKDDIIRGCDTDENKTSAEAIKVLAEAYNIVHRGKKENF